MMLKRHHKILIIGFLLALLAMLVFMALQSGAAQNSISGEYKRFYQGKPDKNSSTIKISEQNDGKIHVEGNAVWVGNAETGDVNTGELDGAFPLKGNKISYSDGPDDETCKLTITFSENILTVSDDNMKCGGLNVTFNGDYRKTGATTNNTASLQSAHTQFVKEFYDNFYVAYKKYIEGKNRSLSNYKNLFTSKNYFSDQIYFYLIDNERRQLANPGEITGLGFDPFIDAQDNIGKPIIGEAKAVGAKTLVTVSFSMARDHKVILELSPSQNGLVVSNILYPEEKTDLLKLFLKLKDGNAR